MKHGRPRVAPPKGSTVIIAFMYATWCAYLALQVWCKHFTGSYLPAEVTYGTAALFIAETVSLARLKMAKEGQPIGQRKANAFLGKMGVAVDDFEEEAQKAAPKEESNERIEAEAR